VRRVLALLFRSRRAADPPRRDSDPDRLLRIYRETVAEMQDLQRAA
jgi:hypothetical protein